MRVYQWNPSNKGVWGHAAIQIGNEYFSFYPNHEDSSKYERWKTLAQDEENLGKASEIIEINVDGIFHPYIFDMYNPSNTHYGMFSYRGMGGVPYNLLENNCCHQVACFIDSAITPYLIDIFGDPKSNTYWLNYQDEQYSQARYEKLQKLYCKYNTDSDVVFTKSILGYWVLCRLYRMAMLHKYGSHVASQIIAKELLFYKGRVKQPDSEVCWSLSTIVYYARFAKAVVEDLSGKVPAIPWIYTVEWKNINGEAKPKNVSKLNDFQRKDLGFENVNSQIKRLASLGDLIPKKD